MGEISDFHTIHVFHLTSVCCVIHVHTSQLHKPRLFTPWLFPSLPNRHLFSNVQACATWLLLQKRIPAPLHPVMEIVFTSCLPVGWIIWDLVCLWEVVGSVKEYTIVNTENMALVENEKNGGEKAFVSILTSPSFLKCLRWTFHASLFLLQLNKALFSCQVEFC